MTFIGYGILVNGKPGGTWPTSFEYAQAALARYRTSAPDKQVEIVPIYHGKPATTALPSGVFA